MAQKMPVGPCIPVGIQLKRAEVGPTSGPTWRLSHWVFLTARAPNLSEKESLSRSGAAAGGAVILAEHDSDARKTTV